jgi:ABC-type multidrug transport system fused ATPase/permease subunit
MATSRASSSESDAVAASNNTTMKHNSDSEDDLEAQYRYFGAAIAAASGGDGDGDGDGDESALKGRPKPVGFGRLLAQAKPERGLLLLATLALFISAAATLAIPSYVGRIIDALSKTDTDTAKEDLRQAVYVLCGVVGVSGVFTFIRGTLFTIAGARVIKRLRNRLFEATLEQEVGFFDVTKTGEIVNRLASDTDVVKNVVTINISMGLRQIVTVIGGLAYLFIISWKLTLIMLSVVPVSAISARIYGKKVKALSKATQDALARASEVADESISNVRTVRSFAREEYQCKQYFAKIEDTYNLNVRFAIAYGAFMGIISAVAGGAVVLILYCGGRFVLDGELTSGVLTSFVLYSLTIGFSMGSLSGLFSQFMQAIGASERIFQIIDRQPSIPLRGGKRFAVRRQQSNDNHNSDEKKRINDNGNDHPDGPGADSVSVSIRSSSYPSTQTASSDDEVLQTPLLDDRGSEYFSDDNHYDDEDGDDSKHIEYVPGEFQGHIELANVGFRYPSRPSVKVLSDVSIELKPGTVSALVGASGHGKSTVVSLIQRFYDTTEGSVCIDGHNIRDFDLKWLHQHIGLVRQEPVLFACSIADNIRYGVHRHVTDEDIIRAAKVANAHEFVMRVGGYHVQVGEKGIRLSGGQKQRIAIARAVLMDPKILLLDESTSSLDSESEHLVQQALDRLMRGRTVLVIAHRLSTVKDCDCIFVIDNGSVAEKGTHQQLLGHNGVYARLVERQLQ